MPEQLALNRRFEVSVDGVELGTWTECSGLEASYDVKTYAEGGQNGFEHKIPGRLTFSNVTLKRPIDADSAKTAAWFSRQQGGGLQPKTASITLYDGDSKKVTDWTLTGVLPVKWSGPSFSATSSEVAVETLELAHQGFGP